MSMTIICCMPPQPQRWRPPSCVRTSIILATSMPISLAVALGVAPVVLALVVGELLPAWQTGARWRVASAAGQSGYACGKCAAPSRRISPLASAHVHSQRWKPKQIYSKSHTDGRNWISSYSHTHAVFSHCIHNSYAHCNKFPTIFWVISHLTTS